MNKNNILTSLVILLLIIPATSKAQVENIDDLFNIYGFEIYQIVKQIPDLSLSDNVLNRLEKYNDYVSFDPRVGSISKILNKYKIEFKPNVVKGEDKIYKWKIRVNCEGGIKALLNSNDVCGESFEENSGIENVYLNVSNKSNENGGVNVKFRAFDQNDNWISSNDVNVTLPSGN